MARRRRDRWTPPEALSVPPEARDRPAVELHPPLPVWAWVQTPRQLLRVEGRALWASRDCVLVEYGYGQAATSAWVWRSAVKHRGDTRRLVRD